MQTATNLNPWMGLRARLGGWLMAGPSRRLVDIISGDVRSRALDAMTISGDEQVVDLGAGSGYYSIAIAQKLDIGRIVCVDNSDKMLDVLRKRASWSNLDDRVEIREGNSSRIPVENGSSDLSLCTMLIHEIEDPREAISELFRVLRPGGKTVIVDFFSTPLKNTVMKFMHPKGAHGPMKIFDIQEVLEEVGFHKIRIDIIGGFMIVSAKKPDTN